MVSWDTLLSYDTVKLVTVRDKRLGAIKYACMMSIAVYSNPQRTVSWSLVCDHDAKGILLQ